MSSQDGFSKDWGDDGADFGEQYFSEYSELDLAALYEVPLPPLEAPRPPYKRPLREMLRDDWRR